MSRHSEDGGLSTYHYESGRFQLSPDPAKCLFIPGKGKATRTTVTYGTEKHPEGIPYRTTRETTITDGMGLEKLRETFRAHDGRVCPHRLAIQNAQSTRESHRNTPCQPHPHRE